MYTFPPFRKQGHGSSALQAATQYIKPSPADAAILFCAPKPEPFYAAQGWQITHSPTRLGTPDRYETYNPTRLMVFPSEKGQSGKTDFESQPIYIDWPW
jgi:hypothetical protein